MFNKIIVIVNKSFELVVIRIMIRIQEFFTEFCGIKNCEFSTCRRISKGRSAASAEVYAFLGASG